MKRFRNVAILLAFFLAGTAAGGLWEQKLQGAEGPQYSPMVVTAFCVKSNIDGMVANGMPTEMIPEVLPVLQERCAQAFGDFLQWIEDNK
jgi:hypothetical protein